MIKETKHYQGKRIFRLEIEAGEELCRQIEDFARSSLVSPSRCVAEGALSEVRLENPEEGIAEKARLDFHGEARLCDLKGRIVTGNGNLRVDLRAVVRTPGGVYSGRVVKAVAREMLEVDVTETS